MPIIKTERRHLHGLINTKEGWEGKCLFKRLHQQSSCSGRIQTFCFPDLTTNHFVNLNAVFFGFVCLFVFSTFDSSYIFFRAGY